VQLNGIGEFKGSHSIVEKSKRIKGGGADIMFREIED